MRRIVTAAEYESMMRSTPPLGAADWFEYQLSALVKYRLATRKDGDLFREKLPTDGKPFLFIPPVPKVFDLGEFMERVVLDGKVGVNYLNAADLIDIGEVPSGAQLLLDVEDGRARRGVRPSVSAANITREQRVAYTTFRGIIHAILFPFVLRHHNLDLVGSRYLSGGVPVLYLHDGKPTLGNGWDDDALPCWGAPSCGSVVLGV